MLRLRTSHSEEIGSLSEEILSKKLGTNFIFPAGRSVAFPSASVSLRGAFQGVSVVEENHKSCVTLLASGYHSGSRWRKCFVPISSLCMMSLVI